MAVWCSGSLGWPVGVGRQDRVGAIGDVYDKLVRRGDTKALLLTEYVAARYPDDQDNNDDDKGYSTHNGTGDGGGWDLLVACCCAVI